MIIKPSVKPKLPPLENGDRLSRDEFERRYQGMAESKKAELIEGIVYMASPLRFKSHAEPHSNLMIWLGTYNLATQGVRLGIEPTLRLDLDNEPQPDAVLFIDENLGGKCHITEDDYLEGSPEFIAEIAASSAGYDLYDKKRVYCRHQIQEYLVWQIYENKIDWFRWQAGEYISLVPDENNLIKSEVLPGLWLEVEALLRGDMLTVIKGLQQGLNSLEHREFLNRSQRDD